MNEQPKQPVYYAYNDFITARDWFAAQALILVGKPLIGPKYYQKCAEEAYQIADAMLAARVRK